MTRKGELRLQAPRKVKFAAAWPTKCGKSRRRKGEKKLENLSKGVDTKRKYQKQNEKTKAMVEKGLGEQTEKVAKSSNIEWNILGYRRISPRMVLPKKDKTVSVGDERS